MGDVVAVFEEKGNEDWLDRRRKDAQKSRLDWKESLDRFDVDIASLREKIAAKEKEISIRGQGDDVDKTTRSARALQMDALDLGVVGVIFGVASVVAMLGIGLGAEAAMKELLNALGAQNIHVVRKEMSEKEQKKTFDFTIGLSYRDSAAIRQLVPDAEIVELAHWTSAEVNRPLPGPQLQIIGASAHLPDVLPLALQAGRLFTPVEGLLAHPVAAIGEELAVRWFGDIEKAVGEWVRVDFKWFQIVGVFRYGQHAPAAKVSESSDTRKGQPEDDVPAGLAELRRFGEAMVIPLNSGVSRLGSDGPVGMLERLVVKVPETLSPLLVKERLVQTLEALHRGAEVVDVEAADDIIANKRKARRMFSAFLLIIAVISLVVGGIGIANVMLASVVERVREVGLRRALGARRRDIVLQFLTETLVICWLGGVVGWGLGLVAAAVAGVATGWPIALPWWIPASALGISSLVGLLAGLYPALSASRLQPMAALEGRV